MNGFQLKACWRLAGACVLVLAATGCESNKQVGSECKGGVCPRATPISSLTCELSSSYMEIAVFHDTNPETPEFSSLCLPRPLPADSDGRIDCQVLWLVNEGELPDPSTATCGDGSEPCEFADPFPLSCDDLPFLEQAGAGYPENACNAKQLSPDEVAAGDDGWFYDSNTPDCWNDGPAIRFTEGGAPGSGVVVKVTCSQVQAIDENDELVEVADASECALSDEDGEGMVGASCLPVTPSGGYFDPREALVQARSEQCDGGACIALGLDGDPSPDCEEPGGRKRCLGDAEAERAAHCSCRCDAPEGDPGPLCECGAGFSCLELLAEGPPGIRGSYCVNDANLSR